MRPQHSIAFAGSLCALLLASVASAAGPDPQLDRFQIRRTIIEAPNGNVTEASDVNNSGVVAGIYSGPSQARAFAWTRGGGLVDLEGVVDGEFSLALDVNECGQIVGELDGHAARWNTFDEVEDLGTLGGSNSLAHAINDRGDVVGYSQIISGGRGGPFIWTETEGMRGIECPGLSGVAADINNRGEVVGVCEDASRIPQAFFWSEATGRVDFPATGHSMSSALAINDRGEVVGDANFRDPVNRVAAFKWNPRTQRVVYFRQLGDNFDAVRDINRWGWVAGATQDVAQVRRAALWLRPRIGFLVDPGLGSSSSANGLNDVGSIAGTIRLDNGLLRAVLWEAPPRVADWLRRKGAGRCLRP